MKKFICDGENSARVIDATSLKMAQESFELANYV
jgi:hypothetical protein